LGAVGTNDVSLFTPNGVLTATTVLPSPGNPGVGLGLVLPRGTDPAYFLNDVAAVQGFYLVIAKSPIPLGPRSARVINILALSVRQDAAHPTWVNTNPNWRTENLDIDAVYGTLPIRSNLNGGVVEVPLAETYILDQPFIVKVAILL